MITFLRKFGQSAVSLFQGVRIIMTGATFPTNFDAYISELLDVENIQKISTDQLHRVLLHFPQKFIRVALSRKLESFMEIIEKDSSKQKKTLIFSNKASTADFLSMHLNEQNIPCINFDQNVHWKQRENHYRKFAEGEVNVMSATDLASRGLDTTMVNHVINFDFPLNAADYIHRVGRVGRIGGPGSSHVTSLVDNPLAVEVLNRIELAARKNQEIQNVNNNIVRIIQHRIDKKQRIQENVK
ncbi:probable ATP-dependent RNA helicase DDX28 [Eurytemora carolleeae]|uniref:probable ATP-dependent RNA helicase DDX28 n=1 Tax=Eurytemora carolleeae TaxID=1294199 RepID=UPI000C77260E|nr:probable ATP-dependent RNA helicase DDX28 [Eurytemora carolleeae]|eukprot:XP_023347846.1 probable ATP-dependent RNA helicase DDX28 [Eurytemora affinis]